MLTGVTRGFGNTAPRAWQAGTSIVRALASYDHNAFIANILSIMATIGNVSDGVIQFLPRDNFPGVGAINVLYIAIDVPAIYIWNGMGYVSMDDSRDLPQILADIAALQNDVSALQSADIPLLQLINDLQTQINNLPDGCVDLGDILADIAIIQTEITALEGIVDNVEIDIVGLQEKISELAELVDLSMEDTDLTGILSDIQVIHGDLQTLENGLSAEITSREQSLADKQQQISELNSTLADSLLALNDINSKSFAPLSHVGATGGVHGVATPTTSGFMSKADKAKLDSLEPTTGGSNSDFFNARGIIIATPVMRNVTSARDTSIVIQQDHLSPYPNPVPISAGSGVVAIGGRSSSYSSNAVGIRATEHVGHDSVAISGSAWGGYSISIRSNVSAQWAIAIGSLSNISSTGHHSIALGKSIRCTHGMSAILAPGGGGYPVTGQAVGHVSSRSLSSLDLGRPNITVSSYSSIAVISDERDKTDINPLEYDALKFINALKPRQFRMDLRCEYSFFQELTADEYAALPEYDKRHNVVDLKVFALESDGKILPYRWIENQHIIGGVPIADDPCCFENLKIKDCKDMTLGDIPDFKPIGFVKASEIYPDRYEVNNPQFISRFFHDFNEAMAAWKLEQCGVSSSSELSRSRSIIPFSNPSEPGQDYWEPGVLYDPGTVYVGTVYFCRKHNLSDGSRAGRRKHNGFIAQEVKSAADVAGLNDFAGFLDLSHNKDENGVPLGDDQYMLKTDELVAPMVAAMQDMYKMIRDLQKENNELKARISDIEATLNMQNNTEGNKSYE